MRLHSFELPSPKLILFRDADRKVIARQQTGSQQVEIYGAVPNGEGDSDAAAGGVDAESRVASLW